MPEGGYVESGCDTFSLPSRMGVTSASHQMVGGNDATDLVLDPNKNSVIAEMLPVAGECDFWFIRTKNLGGSVCEGQYATYKNVVIVRQLHC